jgi:hypothetical protein
MRSLFLLLLLLGSAGNIRAEATGNAVDVQIRSDSGRILPLFPVATPSANRRVYVEAVKGDHYSILVRNLLNRRVGVVVAVDGRNIISGKKSWLRNDERMYILEPYGQGEFKGWRTNLDNINRFYFTDAADSYAAAFHDESAMGVIAVAVYPEVPRQDPADLSRSSMGGLPRRTWAKSEAERRTGFGSRALSGVVVLAGGRGRGEDSSNTRRSAPSAGLFAAARTCSAKPAGRRRLRAPPPGRS